MTNWREVLSYRSSVQPAPEGYEEGDPPYSEDEDFDPEGKVHQYSVSYSQTEFGSGDVFGRCTREARDREGIVGLENQETYDYSGFEIDWDSIEDEGISRRRNR